MICQTEQWEMYVIEHLVHYSAFVSSKDNHVPDATGEDHCLHGPQGIFGLDKRTCPEWDLSQTAAFWGAGLNGKVWARLGNRE